METEIRLRTLCRDELGQIVKARQLAKLDVMAEANYRCRTALAAHGLVEWHELALAHIHQAMLAASQQKLTDALAVSSLMASVEEMVCGLMSRDLLEGPKQTGLWGALAAPAATVACPWALVPDCPVATVRAALADVAPATRWGGAVLPGRGRAPVMRKAHIPPKHLQGRMSDGEVDNRWTNKSEVVW